MKSTLETLTAQWRQLECIYPMKDQQGRQGTIACFTDGAHEFLAYRPQTCVHNLCRFFGKGLPQVKYLARTLEPVGTRRNPPLLVGKFFTLIGVKCRESPPGIRDGTLLGYVVLEQIFKVVTTPEGITRVLFLSGNYLEVPQSRRSILAAIALAWELKDKYKQQRD